MQPSALRVRIEQPCGEDWLAMTPRGSGRHCAACARTVVDFTHFTDAELVAYLQKHPNTCGRFAPRQLNRSLPFPPAPRRVPALPKWVAGALLLAAAQSASAQSNNQLSPELPKCDDSTTAVELRMDGYVPLVPDSSLSADTTRLDTVLVADSLPSPDTAFLAVDSGGLQPCLHFTLDSMRSVLKAEIDTLRLEYLNMVMGAAFVEMKVDRHWILYPDEHRQEDHIYPSGPAAERFLPVPLGAPDLPVPERPLPAERVTAVVPRRFDDEEPAADGSED